MSRIQSLLNYNDRGHSLPEEDFGEQVRIWHLNNPSERIFGPIVKHAWTIDGAKFERINPRNDALALLPDRSGLLLCEKINCTDNLVLLDTHGNERLRLAVPWQMTGSTHTESGRYPTRFIGPTTPWENPATGEPGHFGVLAWVEYAGDYYFELDYRNGKFLWCKRLEHY